ncbi:hypothetical protein BHS06_09350 [Myxococcus xanthus]|nr:hypothetical protein BHS06_09350 [Myxococcus xanthus]
MERKKSLVETREPARSRVTLRKNSCRVKRREVPLGDGVAHTDVSTRKLDRSRNFNRIISAADKRA